MEALILNVSDHRGLSEEGESASGDPELGRSAMLRNCTGFRVGAGVFLRSDDGFLNVHPAGDNAAEGWTDQRGAWAPVSSVFMTF